MELLPGQVWTCRANRHRGYRVRILKVMARTVYVLIVIGGGRGKQTTLQITGFLHQHELA